MAQVDATRSDEPGTAAAWSGEQRAAIEAESQFILSHGAFKSSKRCVALFQFLVDRALDGDLDGVKERTLGVEVFGRTPGYDTNLDPIVRMSANEIRKRLALCYQDEDRARRVRIQLLPGSYVPHFEMLAEAGAETAA